MAGGPLHNATGFEKILGHALVGGALSGGGNALQEGSFRDGFIGAFASALSSGLIGQIAPNAGFAGVALRAAAAAVVGGTAAEITGGKFRTAQYRLRFYDFLMTKRFLRVGTGF